MQQNGINHMNRNKKNRMIAIVAVFLPATLLLLLGAQTSRAGSAQWNLNPIRGNFGSDWNTADNWTPMTVPNGPADTATFGLTNIADVIVWASTEVNGISFNAGASAYSITAFDTLTISGTGIANNSGSRQNFFTVAGSIIKFTNSATAGNGWFGNSTIDCCAGFTEFHDSSTAGNGRFFMGGYPSDRSGARTRFFDNSTAGNANIVNGVPDTGTDFFDSSTAGTAIIDNSGGDLIGGGPGVTNFRGTSSAGDSTITIGAGFNHGGGAATFFLDDSTGGMARIEVFAEHGAIFPQNGLLNIAGHNAPGVTIGSLEGDGDVYIGPNNLRVGANNLSTTFSGGMTGGSFTKIGTGTLILSGANYLGGGTRVSAGTLLINNNDVPGTDYGSVIVDGGATLGGNGTIRLYGGALLTNNGTIAPGDSTGQLTVDGNLQLGSSSNLSFQIGGTAAGVGYDVLEINGHALTLHGMLTVSLINGFTPQQSDTFTIVRTQAPLAGSFTNVNSGGRLNTADGGGSFEVTYSGVNNVMLSRFGPPVTGHGAANISTRLAVGTGDNVLIGGIIIQGSVGKRVIIRAIGPSLTQHGVPGALQDPTLELHDHTGALIGQNDNWRTTEIGGVITSNQVAAIQATHLAPSDNRESAIIATLQPGNYTAIVRGKNNTMGIALVEAYDLDPGADSRLANISTRGFVQTSNNVMIGGFIFNQSGNATVLIRAIGPELTQHNVPNALQNPTLELHNGNGALIASNDDWRSNQEQAIEATGLAPTDDRESAILAILSPGNYTAIVRGKNSSTGNALVEVYVLQ
jgi:autotransporter-associated beta strand protein